MHTGLMTAKEQQSKKKNNPNACCGHGVPFALHFRRGPAAPRPPVNPGRPAGDVAPTSPPDAQLPWRQDGDGEESGKIFLVHKHRHLRGQRLSPGKSLSSLGVENLIRFA